MEIFRRLFPSRPDASNPILPAEKQVLAWRRADRDMGWGIGDEALQGVSQPPDLTQVDRIQGFVGALLCFGFGDDGTGSADAVLSGRLPWEYALKRRKRRIWRCEYANLSRPGNVRLRPDAPKRPKGFYWVRFHPGREFQHLSVSRFRRGIRNATGCGPEGFQLLCVTHPHIANLMNQRKMAFMALADYDVAPHGFNDFSEAPQLFCSQGILGLGVGNVDGQYPLFGIPMIRF